MLIRIANIFIYSHIPIFSNLWTAKLISYSNLPFSDNYIWYYLDKHKEILSRPFLAPLWQKQKQTKAC